ncbi:MAG: hypothetical protein WCK80_02250 [bacterium]
MYKAYQKKKSKKKRRLVRALVAALVILIGFVIYHFISQALQPKVVIKQSNSYETKVEYKNQTRQFDAPMFKIELPVSWRETAVESGTYKTYAFTSTDNKDPQLITIYVDSTPINLATNRVLSVQAQGDRVGVIGAVSDNCTNFTKNEPLQNGQQGVNAKWQGISFICDSISPTRNVVGSGSTDGLNTVVLTSPNDGATHRFYFTDNFTGPNPDYNVFINALSSFRLK